MAKPPMPVDRCEGVNANRASPEAFAPQLVNNERGVRATITTTYRFDPTFNLDVPAEMHEEYFLNAGSAPIVGTATYSNVRRFSVEVDERIRKDPR